MNSTSVTRIPCNLDRFFKYWLQFTAPLHRLQGKEIDILAILLKKRFELSKIITEDKLIDQYLFSREVRELMCEESGESMINFRVVLSRLRKANIILDKNRLNKKIIPSLNPKDKRFDLMIIFDMKDDNEQKVTTKPK